MKNIRLNIEGGIATLTFDEPESPVNTMSLQWQDDLAQAAEQVTVEGATFRDRFGAVRAHPSVAIERDFRGLAARQLEKLAARMEGQG